MSSFLHLVAVILNIVAIILAFTSLIVVPIYWFFSMGQKQSKFRPLHIFLFGLFLFFLLAFVINMLEFASDREEEIISNHKYSIVKNFYENDFKCRAIYLEEKLSDNQLIELSQKIKNKRYEYTEQVTIEYWTDKKAAKDRQAKDKLKAVYTYNSKEKISNLIVYKGKTEKKYQVKIKEKPTEVKEVAKKEEAPKFNENVYNAELKVLEKIIEDSGIFSSYGTSRYYSTYDLVVNDIWYYTPVHAKEELLHAIYLAYGRILDKAGYVGNGHYIHVNDKIGRRIAKVNGFSGVKIYK